MASYTKYKRTMAFRIYMSDSLYYQGQEKRLSVQYADVIEYAKGHKDERNGDEIASDVIKSAGLKFE